MLNWWQIILIAFWAAVAGILLFVGVCPAQIIQTRGGRHVKPVVAGGVSLPDPVNYWPITTTNDSNAFINDSWGGLQFTNTTGAFLTNDGATVSYYFDGLDDFAWKGTNNYLSGVQQGSISLWVRAETAANYLFTSADQDVNNVYATMGIYSNTFCWQDSVDAGLVHWGETLKINDANWHHGVVVSTSTSYLFYVDGILQTTYSNDGAASNNGDWFGDVADRDNVALGSMKRLSQIFGFKGRIDEIKVFTNVLASNQVWQLFQNGH